MVFKRDPAFKWFVVCDRPNVWGYLLASHGLKHTHPPQGVDPMDNSTDPYQSPLVFFPRKKGEEGRKVLHSTGMYQLILIDLLLFVCNINIIMFKPLIFDIIWSWLTSCDLSTIFSEFLATKKDSHVSKPLTDWLVVTPFFSENPKGNRIYRLGNMPNSKPISCWSTHIKMPPDWLIDWF